MNSVIIHNKLVSTAVGLMKLCSEETSIHTGKIYPVICFRGFKWQGSELCVGPAMLDIQAALYLLERNQVHRTGCCSEQWQLSYG